MYLFFDTETSGLPRTHKAPVSDLDNWPRIVQIAWLLIDEQGRQHQAVTSLAARLSLSSGAPAIAANLAMP
jgi:hypothetical protein